MVLVVKVLLPSLSSQKPKFRMITSRAEATDTGQEPLAEPWAQSTPAPFLGGETHGGRGGPSNVSAELRPAGHFPLTELHEDSFHL